MDKRTIWVTGAVALVVAAVAIALSLAGGEADGEGAPATIQGFAAVRDELRGIPQNGNMLGEPDAPVVIIEYGDIACPACRAASESTIPGVVDGLVREGLARLEFRPIAFISPSSVRGVFALEAAAEQDATWPLATLLYRNQGDERDDWLTEELLEEAVRGLGLDLAAWRRAYTSDAVRLRAVEHERAAQADGVDSTPTFVVRSLSGVRVLVGAAQPSEIADAVAAVAPEP